MKTYHLMFFRSNWALLAENAEGPEVVFNLLPKSEALELAAEYFEEKNMYVLLKIHNVTGRIEEERVYSPEPHTAQVAGWA